MVVATLIIFGGLGFAVIADLTRFKGIRKMSLHSKLVLLVTISLIVFGFFSILLLEYNNFETMGSFTWGEKFVASFFASVTPRTAGYNTLDLNGLTMPTRFYHDDINVYRWIAGFNSGRIKDDDVWGYDFISHRNRCCR